MKHVKLFEKFLKENNKQEIKLRHWNYLDPDTKTLTVHYDSDGWFKRSDYVRDLKLLAKNENDQMAEEIRDALKPYGYEIDFKKKHDVDTSFGIVEFQLIKTK